MYLNKQSPKTKAEQDLIDIADKEQEDKRGFKGQAFTRQFAGKVKDVAELRNPLCLSSLVSEIDEILAIINPDLKPEIEWFKNLQSAIKVFHNEVIIANRLLGIKNDNTYDVRVFEKVVKEKFWMQLSKNSVKPDTPIRTTFETMVEMVELGVRRFGH